VDDAARVGGCERVGDLQRVLESFAERQTPARNQPIERFARHVLHDDEVLAALREDVMEGDDAGMIQRGSRPGLLDETTLAVGIEELPGRQHF
jgi:hypothetical protein